jgi:CDP-2,3-bis-(O-geranylgeranyl)-sn-glycerol synthase
MIPILEALALVLWANGAPVLAGLLLGPRLAQPLDGGRSCNDGRPLLGHAKTWRGVGAAVLTTPLVAIVLGLAWWIGLIAALGAMSGDLASSFLKRRLGRLPSQPVWLLDQLPEALAPVLLLVPVLGLSPLQATVTVIAFSLIDLVLTPVLHWLRGRRPRH